MDLQSLQSQAATLAAGLASGIDANYTQKSVLALLQDPSRNPRLAVLVMAFAVLLLLLVVLILLLIATPSRKKVVVRRLVTVGDDAEPVPDPPLPQPAPLKPASRLFLALTGPAAVAVLVVAAFVALYVGTTTDEYCSRTCHGSTPAVADATKTNHARCVSCHEDPGIFGVLPNAASRLRMASNYLTRSGPGVVATSVDSRTCLSCHHETTQRTVTSSAGLRISHKELLLAGVPCVQCHRDMGHTKRAYVGSMSACIVCHDGDKASSECITCHVKDPVTSTFASGESTDTIGTGRINYPAVRAANRECGGCHDVKRQCDTCHGIRMPHSNDFIAYEHARAAAFGQKDVCFRCHVLTDCGYCHTAQFNLVTGNGGHGLNWAQEHKSAPWSGGCACHTHNPQRKDSMCGLCHDLKTHALLPIEP